jgi:transposase
MTSNSSTTSSAVRVAIDVAKLTHQVLLELPSGQRRAMRIANTKTEIDRFVAMLCAFRLPCEIAFEPTGDYHRPLGYLLGQAGFHLSLVSSIAVARTREALYNSWDKNDPKDAQVILHLLKNGTTQRYLDPVVTGHQDLQEMANTYQQVSLRKVRLQHSLITHHLPLYFPEAERYLHSSRAEWFTQLLLFAPCPAAVRQYTKAAFVAAAREEIAGRKVDKARSRRLLRDRLHQCGAARGRDVGDHPDVSGRARGVSGALPTAQASGDRDCDAAGDAARLCPVADHPGDRADPGDDHLGRSA